MKRIVKELKDWRQKGARIKLLPTIRFQQYAPINVVVDACSDNEISFIFNSKVWTETYYPHEDEDGISYLVTAKESKVEYLICPEDQITFEQAFKTWDDKPIAFIGKDSTVFWIVEYSPQLAKRDNTFYVLSNHKELDGEACYTLDIIKSLEPFNCYQAESNEDLHLNVIPTLIRMARGEG